MGPLLCQGLCQEELERKRPLNFSLNLASERHFTPDQYNSIQTTILSISIFQRFKDAKPNNFFNFLKTAKSLVKISPPTVLLTYILYVITTSQDCETIFILYTKYQLVTEPTLRGFLVKKNSKKFVTHQNRQDTYYENSHFLTDLAAFNVIKTRIQNSLGST